MWAGRRERRRAEEWGRGSCSVFIHLLISPPYLKAFHLSEHPSIHPSLHSFSRQSSRASIHPPIYRCGRYPPLPPNHASISLSIFPFPPLSPPLPSIHLSVTPSPPDSISAAPLIYLYRIFHSFSEKHGG